MEQYSSFFIIGFILYACLSKTCFMAESGHCFFNACTLTTQEYCFNGGKCMLNGTTCRNYCECAEGFVGSRCETPELHGPATDQASNDEYVLPHVEDRTCSETFVCFHGICDTNSYFLRCICEYGWTGTVCDTNIQQTTRNSYTAGYVSQTVTSSSTVVNTVADALYNVCSDSRLERHLSNRTCTPTLVCKYGVCHRTLVQHSGWHGWEYSCICDPGAVGLLCEDPCCLDCGPNGRCQVEEDAGYCQCDRGYTGPDCSVFVPDPVHVEVREATWYMWIVGACAGTLVALVTLLVVTPYMMWRHRVVLVMKVVHYFQAYEDDDDKQWDAFVSYKSDAADESFVVQQLYPKLEQELGLKLCLHFRDFIPGETIANNIINAVEGSRRTIIVLTPRYIESEFTRFEYQKAQHEMLKQKHRIIPIMLEDISSIKSTMDKNLQGIINSVTYLEWPEQSNTKKVDKFWKRLQLSLPKLKESSSETSQPPITSTLTSLSEQRPVSSSKGRCCSVPSVYSSPSFDLSDSDNYYSSETIYTEISEIDESCGNSEILSIKPFSENEERQLSEACVSRETADNVDDTEHQYNSVILNIADTQIVSDNTVTRFSIDVDDKHYTGNNFSNHINPFPVDSDEESFTCDNDINTITTVDDITVDFSNPCDVLNINRVDKCENMTTIEPNEIITIADSEQEGVDATTNSLIDDIDLHSTVNTCIEPQTFISGSDKRSGIIRESSSINDRVEQNIIQGYIDMLENVTVV